MSTRTRKQAVSKSSGTVGILAQFASRGAGPLAIAGFFLLMRDLLAKGIFPPLTGYQGYIVILTVVGLAWLLAVAGILSRLGNRRHHRRGRARAAGKLRSASGASQAHVEKNDGAAAIPLRRDTPRARTC